MRRMYKSVIAKALSVGLMFSALSAGSAFAAGIPTPEGYTTPFEQYGSVKVAKDPETGYQQLCDETGNPVQLKGMSTFGLQWGDGNWVLNDAAFDALAYDWKCNIIRLALYVTENGYATDPAAGLERVEKGIQLATERGMYVLVDWHILSPGDPTDPKYLEAGVDLPQYAEIRAEHPEYNGPQLFFAYLSQKYGDQGNVLFETANEPNGNGSEDGAAQTWKEKLLPYHQSVVDAIREYDKDAIPNVVICGTDNWSQFVDAPVANPVVDPAVEAEQADDAQIMYTFHFYAGTHDTKIDEKTGDYWLGGKIKNALEGGIGVFCTEWGTSESTGDGGPYINYAERWLTFLDEYKISWCSWSLALKNEISAAMQGGATKEPTDPDNDGIPNWNYATDDTNKDLSITGNYVRAKIRGEEAPRYGAAEMITDFEDGLPVAIVTGDDDSMSAADYPLTVEDIGGTKALVFGANSLGPWAGAPRVSFQDLGNVYSLYSDITFDVYLPEGTALVDGKLEIQPILQTPGLNYWGQLDQYTLTESDFAPDEATGLMKATAKINFDSIKVPEDKLGHITLLLGPTEGFYMDNLGLETWYNGDIADAPIIPDNPGSFIGLPFTFENDQREGWKPEGSSTIDYLTIAIEEVGVNDHAMSFPVKLEAGKNEWEDGVRLTSPHGILTLEESKNVEALAMNVYLEKDKATTGAIRIAVCSTPNGDGYWYQSGEFELDPVQGGEAVSAPGGRELLKYNVYVPVNQVADQYGEYSFSENVLIRNIILALHNEDSDYEGRVYYDNIRYVDAEKLDEIDKEFNFSKHADIVMKLAASEGATDKQLIMALEVAADPMMTAEKFKSYGLEISKLADKVAKIEGNPFSEKEMNAIKEKIDGKKDPEPTKKYKSEWIKGQWYDAKGSSSYKYKGSWKGSAKAGWRFGDTSGWYARNQWQKIDGKWYFFDKEGYMEANAYRQGYYLKANGAWDGKAKVAGWKQNSKGWWYSLDVSDFLKNGWKKIDGNWYYFKATGYIAINEFIQGWWLNKAGALKDPVKYSWHKSGNKWWYGTKDGWYAKGKSYTIDGKKYTFDKKGYTK
ncbi:MAG: cellulase family glycosylhydrolase [Eubacterium sp.]|nr:cellulase family glycosylhydrolase [Eubacterium sp.]